MSEPFASKAVKSLPRSFGCCRGRARTGKICLRVIMAIGCKTKQGTQTEKSTVPITMLSFVVLPVFAHLWNDSQPRCPLMAETGSRTSRSPGD